MVDSTSTTTRTGDVKFATNRAEKSFNQALKRANKAYKKTNNEFFKGPLLADPQEEQKQARQGLLDIADRSQGDFDQTINLAEQLQGTGQGVVQRSQDLQGVSQPVIDLAKDTASGQFLDVRDSPAFQANINAAIDPLREQLTQEILPQAQSQAIQQGAFGGSRDQLNRRAALEDFSEQASQTASQIASSMFENERQRQQQAGRLLQSGIGAEQSGADLARRGAATMNDFKNIMADARKLQTFGPRLTAQVGARERADQQAEFDADQRRFQMKQQAPWIGLPQFASVVSGSPTSTSQTQRSTPSESQQVGNYIQGGLGLASGINQLTDTGDGGIIARGLESAGDFIGGLF